MICCTNLQVSIILFLHDFRKELHNFRQNFLDKLKTILPAKDY